MADYHKAEAQLSPVRPEAAPLLDLSMEHLLKERLDDGFACSVQIRSRSRGARQFRMNENR
jgi:hypothetical protein